MDKTARLWSRPKRWARPTNDTGMDIAPFAPSRDKPALTSDVEVETVLDRADRTDIGLTDTKPGEPAPNLFDRGPTEAAPRSGDDPKAALAGSADAEPRIADKTTGDETAGDKTTGDKAAADKATAQKCFFYHTMDLPVVGTVDGGWDLRGRFGDYIGHVDLAGKRVLDVGTASGFLSFEAERAGAQSVVSFDLDTAERQDLLPFAGSTYVTDHAAWCRQQTMLFDTWKNGYRLAHRLLGSNARPVYGDVYRLPDAVGRVDVAIMGAIIEHLIDPLSALRSVAAATDDYLVINTDYFDTPGAVALFKGHASMPNHSFVFWTYSIALFDEYMSIMGFKKEREHRDTFAATRPAPNVPRPLLPRVALVYRRDRAA